MRLARFARVRLLRYALPISLLILRKEPTVLQSTTRLINRPLMDLHTNDKQKHFGGQTDVKLELNSLTFRRLPAKAGALPIACLMESSSN